MKKTSDVAFCGLVSSVSVVLLVFACVFSNFSMFITAFCGSFIYITAIKIGKKASFALYITVCLTSIFFVFRISVLLIYIFFCGLYPIFKIFIDSLKNYTIKFFVKLIVFLILSLFLSSFLLLFIYLLNIRYLIVEGYRYIFLQSFFSLILYFFVYDHLVILFTNKYFISLDNKILKSFYR